MLRVGTRSSRLALAQTQEVIDLIHRVDPSINCEIVRIRTTGDLITDRPLVDIGGKALFLKEIEESLLLGKIDIAVHSLKDVPAILPDGLVIPAVTERVSPEDVLISHHKLSDLPSGTVIGTCSSRRKAFLKNLLGDGVDVVDLRGNIDTRLEKFKSGQLDGLILAKAGIQRLKLSDYITETIPEDIMLPAVGQGAIAIECREDKGDIISLLRKINHYETFQCISAERSFMIEIGGNCKTPIAGLCKLRGDVLCLKAAFAVPDGSHIFYAEESGSDPYSIGMVVAKHIKHDITNSRYFESVNELFTC